MEWEVELKKAVPEMTDEQLVQATLLYNNLMYDLVGAVLGKLGWEYSKLMSGEVDRSAFDKTMGTVQRALATGEK